MNDAWKKALLLFLICMNYRYAEASQKDAGIDSFLWIGCWKLGSKELSLCT